MFNKFKKVILILLIIYSFLITMLLAFPEKKISLLDVRTFLTRIMTLKMKIVTNLDIGVSCEKNNELWNYLAFSSYETMDDVWTSLFITAEVPKKEWKEKREKKKCFVFNYGNDKIPYDYERFANKSWYFKVQDRVYHYDKNLWFSTWWVYSKKLKFK